MEGYNSIFVEAIEEGKIVKVPEEYARKEGLPILRKQNLTRLREPQTVEIKKRYEPRSTIDLIEKKSKDWKKNQVISELVDNFHWRIRVERRNKGVSRKQLAQLINEPEIAVKSLEYGVLPSNDFVLINKIQKALGINLRKDGKTFNPPMKEILQKSMDASKITIEKNSIEGDDIEILDDEIY